MRSRSLLLAAGPLLLVLAAIFAALTTRTWDLELVENEPLYLPQLDAALTVSDYRVDYHPRTTTPRSWSCRLTLADGADTTNAVLAVNQPVELRGHRLYLTGSRIYQDPFRFVVVLVLRRFPAWPAVLAGIVATLLCALGLALLAVFRSGPDPVRSSGRARWVRLAALPVVLAAGIMVVLRTAATGHLPFSNMYEALLFWSLSVALFQLLPSDAGIPGLAAAVVLLAATFVLPDRLTVARPLAPALVSGWFTPHIAAAFLGYGGLTAATIAPRRGLALPVGFVLFSLALAFGMIWAEQSWANFWSWDPKETWALVTWLLMAVALVLRLAGKKRIERAVTALAFATVLYNYVVVNLVLRGLHSYR